MALQAVERFNEDFGFTSEPSGHLVTAKLTSVEHAAARGDEVATDFDCNIHVSDGGRNESILLDLEDKTLRPGQKLTLNEQIFIGEYSSLSVGAISFTFIAIGGGELGIFVGVTVGDNTLKPGVQHFKAPVVLETASGDRSTLIFRGRIDLV
ncbi:MAG: hypothetical protein QNJ30_22190 [Kiloniellales bacterium]|nr:hypothetical protein [Kiloniellales bacterium]